MNQLFTKLFVNHNCFTKAAASIALVLLLYSPALSQGFEVSGQVVTVENEPLAGVNIVEVGTQNGTTTNANGEFALTVSDEEAQIRATFIGFQAKTVNVDGQSAITIELEEAVGTLDEMVVTAFGVEKQEKSLGYSVSQVNAEDFTKARTTNVAQNLAGEVAGLTVSSPPTGPAGSSRIVIRGNASLTGNNEPLIVVDGVPIDNRNIGQAGMWGGFDGGDGISSINPDDIQSMTVLKGPAAAALYGTRAQNGAIEITTKSGRGQDGFSVEVKSNVTFDDILVNYDDFQNEYGQGTLGAAPTSQAEALSTGLSSWGAKIEGQSVVMFDGQSRPYVAHDDNLQNFYQTGTTFTNTVAVSGGDENSSFRLSLSQLNNEGIIETSTLDRNNFNFRGRRAFGSLSVEAKANYIIEKTDFRPELSDNPANPALSLSYMPSTLDVNLLKNYKDENGNHIPFSNSNFRPNPYWGINETDNNDEKRRLIGFVRLNYNFNDWLSLQGRAGTDFYTLRRTGFDNAGSPWITGGQLEEDEFRVREDSYNLLASFQRSINEDLSFSGNAGVNRRYEKFENLGLYGRDFVVPNLITIGNTDQNTRSTDYGFNEKEVNSVLGSVQFDYKNYLFLEVTARNDWSSTLPDENDSYFYPSVNTGFTFTDAFDLSNDILSFGKIRASWAQVGGDTDPYSLSLAYGVFGSHPDINGGNVSYGGITSGTIPLADLKPTSTEALEFGLDLRFLDGRANFDFTWYKQNTTDQILGTTISNTSGYGSRTINAGEIENKGIEVLLRGAPVQSNDFRWDLTLNFARNRNEVVALDEGLESLRIGTSRSQIAFIEAQVGEPYGQIVGRGYQRNDQGQIIFGDDGIPLFEDNVVLGNASPDWTGGIGNNFFYKNFSLSTLIDISQGGDIYSLTNAQAYGTGKHVNTLEGRESFINDPVNGGVVGDGATEGDSQNNIAVDPEIYYGRIASDIAEEFVYDASYIKLRQVILGYNLPQNLLRNLPIREASISAVGRNLLILHKNTPNIDPESNINTGNDQGLEHATLPTTRTFGFDITLKF